MPKNCIDHVGVDHVGGANITLWSLADPDAAVQAAVDVYGSSAATAAAYCALTAHFDGREDDYRFWSTVFSKVKRRSECISD